MRIFELDKFKAVCADPQICEAINISSPDDLDVFQGIYNVFLLWYDTGGFIVVPKDQPGVYECHTLFPIGTGLPTVAKCAKDAQEWMFIHTDCIRIITYAPENNKSALGLMRLCNFEQWFTRPAAWPGKNGMSYTLHYGKLDLDTWIRTCSTVGRRGIIFHSALETMKQHVEHHAFDTVHDAYVGTALLMAEAGNGMKGVKIYNDWAEISGYHLIQVLTEAPLTVFTGDAIIAIRNGRAEIVQCL